MTPDAFGRAIAAYPALLRAYAGEPVTLAADDALALLDLFDAAAELVVAEHQVEQLTSRLQGASPALDRWRRLVLEAGGKRTPLERAAAWEAHALDMERHGNPALAHRARLAAAQIVEQGLPHGSKHPPKKDHAA